jgi:hypothetical protein
LDDARLNQIPIEQLGLDIAHKGVDLGVTGDNRLQHFFADATRAHVV